MGINSVRASSDIYATNKRKPIIDICFCLEVMICLNILKGLMPNWKCCTLEMKTLIGKLKRLICRWMIK